MPRRFSPQQKKRDWRWYLNMGLNGAVVLSMVLGTILLFAPPPQAPAVPTIVAPTAAPVSAPTPTPTPKAMTFTDSVPAPASLVTLAR